MESVLEHTASWDNFNEYRVLTDNVEVLGIVTKYKENPKELFLQIMHMDCDYPCVEIGLLTLKEIMTLNNFETVSAIVCEESREFWVRIKDCDLGYNYFSLEDIEVHCNSSNIKLCTRGVTT